MSGATENTTLWRDLNKLSLSLRKTCDTMQRMYRHTLGQRIVDKSVEIAGSVHSMHALTLLVSRRKTLYLPKSNWYETLRESDKTPKERET